MVAVTRETVSDGEPALAVDTEEEFDRALGSGVYVVPPSWANAIRAWRAEVLAPQIPIFSISSTVTSSSVRS